MLEAPVQEQELALPAQGLASDLVLVLVSALELVPEQGQVSEQVLALEQELALVRAPELVSAQELGPASA